jgi:hypothetical protein
MELSKRIKTIFFIATVVFWIGGILSMIEHNMSLTLVWVLYISVIGFTMAFAYIDEPKNNT